MSYNLTPGSHVNIIDIDPDQDYQFFKLLPKPIQDFLQYEMPHPTSSVEIFQQMQKLGPRGLLQALVNWRYADSRRAYGPTFPPVRIFKVHDQIAPRCRR